MKGFGCCSLVVNDSSMRTESIKLVSHLPSIIYHLCMHLFSYCCLGPRAYMFVKLLLIRDDHHVFESASGPKIRNPERAIWPLWTLQTEITQPLIITHFSLLFPLKEPFEDNTTGLCMKLWTLCGDYQ